MAFYFKLHCLRHQLVFILWFTHHLRPIRLILSRTTNHLITRRQCPFNRPILTRLIQIHHFRSPMHRQYHTSLLLLGPSLNHLDSSHYRPNPYGLLSVPIRRLVFSFIRLFCHWFKFSRKLRLKSAGSTFPFNRDLLSSFLFRLL